MSKLQVTTWNSHCKLNYTTQALVQQNNLIISKSFLKLNTYSSKTVETRDHATPVTENDHCSRIYEYMKHSLHVMQSHSAYSMDTQKKNF